MTRKEKLEQFRQTLLELQEKDMSVFIMAVLSIETGVTDLSELSLAHLGWLETDGATTFLSEDLIKHVAWESQA